MADITCFHWLFYIILSDILTEAVSDLNVDFSDYRCPNLVLGIIRALVDMENGQIQIVAATDINAQSNVAAWSYQSEHQLVEMYE